MLCWTTSCGDRSGKNMKCWNQDLKTKVSVGTVAQCEQHHGARVTSTAPTSSRFDNASHTAFIFFKGTTSMTLKFNYPFCGRLGKRFEGLVLHEVRQFDRFHFPDWPFTNISASCLIFPQLFHALGLIHTQARPDRNDYIQ